MSGVHCGPGVRQVPWSAYAPWCEPAYHGNNGGATAPGMTGNTITLTYRIASGAPGAVLSDPGVISSYLGDSPESIARSGGAAGGPARRSSAGQRRPGGPLVPTTSGGGWPGI